MPQRNKKYTTIRKYYQVIVNPTPEGAETNIDPTDLPRFNRVIPRPPLVAKKQEPATEPAKNVDVQIEDIPEDLQKTLLNGFWFGVFPIILMIVALFRPLGQYEWLLTAIFFLALMNFKTINEWISRSNVRENMFILTIIELVFKGFGVDLHEYVVRFVTYIFT